MTLFASVGKLLLKTKILFHLIFWIFWIHLFGQMVLILFRAQLFGDLSLGSVIPVPGRGPFNCWLLMVSCFFSAGALGGTFLPYFVKEGRAVYFLQRPQIWWQLPLVCLGLVFLWMALVVAFGIQLTHFLGDFHSKLPVMYFKVGLVLVLSSVTLTFVIGSLSLLVSPGTGIVTVFILTLGIEAISVLDRFGLWVERGPLAVFPRCLPSADLGFDMWKWLHGRPVDAATIRGWVLFALGSLFLYAVLLRLFPKLQSHQI